MTPVEYAKWVKTASLKELLDTVIWESVMEGTAHCGWTDSVRENLVAQVKENVHWAIAQKSAQPEVKEGE